MSTYEYKVKDDVLQLGNGASVSIPGALAVTGNETIGGTLAVTGQTSLTAMVHSWEKVTTTGSSDVADPTTYVTMITSGGAHTVTLADGTFSGQVKKIVITAVAAGTITITPAHFSDGTSLTMAEILDSVELIWDGTNWNIAQGAGLAII